MEDMTEKELKWCKAIEKVVKSMPKSLELVIGCNHADIYNAGCIAETLHKDGDMDNPDKYAKKHYSFNFKGVISGNESQI